MKYVLERYISSRTDNWAISNGHLSGKLWLLSSLALTTAMALLIGMLVNSEETSFCSGVLQFCNLVDKVFTVDDVMTVEANKRFHNLSKELGSIVHHATNARDYWP